MNIELAALERIQEYVKALESENYSSSKIQKKQYNFETTVSQADQKVKVLVYFGKKGIKTIFQGNADSVLYNEVYEITTGDYTLNLKTEELIYDEYIGTDETGKGDYFGPLVVAGMFVDVNSQKKLSEFGVRDSKDLTDVHINKIAKKIRAHFPNQFEIVIINPEKYNQLYSSFKNVNKLLNWAHSKVIENLLNRNQSPTVITDQFSKRPLEVSNKIEYSKVDFIQMPKAEKNIGVAAASILARHEMNKWFDKKVKEGTNVLKGASAEVEKSATKILDKLGKDEFEKLVKLHFKTTLKIYKEVSIT